MNTRSNPLSTSENKHDSGIGDRTDNRADNRVGDRFGNRVDDRAGNRFGDEELDDLLRRAMCRERMPEGLPAATLSFIHAKAGKAAQRAEGSVPTFEEAALSSTVAQTAVPQAVLVQAEVAQPEAPTSEIPTSEALTSEAPTSEVPQAESPQLDGSSYTARPISVSRAASKRRRTPSRRVLFRDALRLMAACLVIGAMAVAGFAFAGETVQVELDGGARVEIGLNRWGRVVRVETSDASLRSTVDGLGVGGQSCAQAVEALLSSDEVVAALGGPEGLSITVSGDDSSQREETLSACARAAEGAGCGGRCFAVDSGTREEALANGMGVGRYALYLEIAALEPAASVEDCRSLTMRELRFLLAEVECGADWSDALAELAESGGVDAGCGSGSGSGMGLGMGHGKGKGAGGGGMGRGRGMNQGSGTDQG